MKKEIEHFIKAEEQMIDRFFNTGPNDWAHNLRANNDGNDLEISQNQRTVSSQKN